MVCILCILLAVLCDPTGAFAGPLTTPTPCTPLPPTGLSFAFSVQPPQPKVGDAVTVAITVSGRGGIPQYTLSGAPPVLQGDTSTVTSNILGTVTYHLVATQAGTVQLVLSVNYETSRGCAEQPIYEFVNETSPQFAVHVVSHSACAGDCDADGAVTVDEIITMVGIALGDQALSTCPDGDADENGVLEIPDLVIAVWHSLTSCRLPDLVPSSSSLFCENGCMQMVEICVANRGAADADRFVIELNGGVAAESPGLAAGTQFCTVSRYISGYPSPSVARVTVDPDDEVMESNEGNNVLEFPTPNPTGCDYCYDVRVAPLRTPTPPPPPRPS